MATGPVGVIEFVDRDTGTKGMTLGQVGKEGRNRGRRSGLSSLFGSDDPRAADSPGSAEIPDRHRAVQCHRQIAERVGRIGTPVEGITPLRQWMTRT